VPATKLPLFALPETVLFPGMTVPLYIFEERYKRMVRDCLADGQHFVTVLTRSHAEVSDTGGLPPVYGVGSYVDILSASENADGTCNILIHAQGRCQVEIVDRLRVEETSGSSYLPYCADEPLALEAADPNLERLSAWDALDTFHGYAKTFFTAEALGQMEAALPEELLYQASFICANIHVPAPSQQVLLEAPSLGARFQLARKMMQERLSAQSEGLEVGG
jgi:ATP-dependent Lon protease